MRSAAFFHDIREVNVAQPKKGTNKRCPPHRLSGKLINDGWFNMSGSWGTCAYGCGAEGFWVKDPGKPPWLGYRTGDTLWFVGDELATVDRVKR